MRYLYRALLSGFLGGLCALVFVAAKDAQAAREARDAAQDAMVFYQTRLLESEHGNQQCIDMFVQANLTEDRCMRHLKKCLGVPEFGK